MSCEGAIRRIGEYFERAGFFDDLARRVAIHTESQEPDQRPELYRYLSDEMQPKGRYTEERVGLVDDFADADGIAVMDFKQAQGAARKWFAGQAIKEAGLPIDDSPFKFVGPPCDRD